MKTPPRRIRIGRWASLSKRETIFQTAEGIEVDSSEQFELIRRRVLFEDVRLVTYHRQRGALYPLLTGLAGLFFLAMAALVASSGRDAWEGAAVLVVTALPFIIAFTLRMIFAVDVITVFGRRSKVAIRFSLRKGRARELYGTICAAARNAQRRRAESMPGTVPNPVPEGVPLPPAE